MNILYYNEETPLELLPQIVRALREKLDAETIAIPNSTHLLINANAEELFALMDKTIVALDIIKEERPEEYKAAARHRYRERIHKAFQKILSEDKKKCLCDNCTAATSCNFEDRGRRTKCEWYSTNPGGI